MAKIGVFVCHCGRNIAGTVDVKRVVEVASKMPDVTYAIDNKYLCSDPGQVMIKQAIKEHILDRVIVASCSPRMHEKTFRDCVESMGLNRYMCEIANIRDQCSWVHLNTEEATIKAIELIEMAITKVKRNIPLVKLSLPITKRALVIGGGIGGIQVSLDIAAARIEVILVERSPSIGGHMAMLSETFPTLDCSQCILTPRTVEVGQNERIKLLTYSEIEEIGGYVGNFEVRIRKKARSIIEKRCTGCGECQERCPTKVISEFDQGLTMRKAIYSLFPQAVPKTPVIDRKNCLYFTKGKCRVCERICPAGAIDYEQKDEIITERVGAIVVATGFELFDHAIYGEYGYGRFKDVITSLQFERMASASGPTHGHIIRPSDGREPKNVVFIQCVGSRDETKGFPYCSKICCMYTAKHTILLKTHIKDAQAYVFYMDVRAAGKNYEEFVRRAIEKEGAVYLRGRVSRIFQQGDKLVVRGVDTLSGTQVEIEADLVVLATAITACSDSTNLARKLGISYDAYNFFQEAHPKLRPVETNKAGIFLAGACQAPKDIPDTVAQAGCAASKVLALLSQDVIYHEPIVVALDEEICSGCGVCVAVCPYGARELDKIKRVAKVIDVLCQGCGACSVICPNGASEQRNFTKRQILEMVDLLI